MVCINPNPVASFYVENGSGETGQAIQPINQTQNAQVFLWDFGDQSLSSSPNPAHVYDLAGNYEITLTAINEFGCQDSYTNLILINDPTIIYVPNAFTPGGFDLNETFLPIVSSGVDRNNYKLLVFNRWGEVMFESRHPEIGWDGSYGKHLAPSGVYVWQIEFQNAQGLKENRKGHVSLLR
jgi:gliding motility-associated-like protein